jgi:hypothetical protein
MTSKPAKQSHHLQLRHQLNFRVRESKASKKQVRFRVQQKSKKAKSEPSQQPVRVESCGFQPRRLATPARTPALAVQQC